MQRMHDAKISVIDHHTTSQQGRQRNGVKMLFIVYGLILLSTFRAEANSICPPSQDQIEQAMNAAHIPGLAVMVVNSKEILYEHAFGYQTPSILSTAQPIDTRSSIFALASISKTLIAFSAMQLVESDQLHLDQDINTYLAPLPKIVHPIHVNSTITVRNVLSHMTSIGPNLNEELKDLYLPGDQFIRTNLTEVIYRYVSKRENWLPDVPGTVASYSNIGAALGALIVERIAKVSFEQYAHDSILEPIGIERTEAGYRLSDFQHRQKDLIGHYVFNASFLDSYQALVPQLNVSEAGNDSNWLYIPPFSLADYPSGLLRMSAHSLSKFLQVFLNQGQPLLKQISSMEEMLRVYGRQSQRPEADSEYGLIWTWLPVGKRRLIGHRGSLPGFTNILMANEQRTMGVIILSTGDLTNSVSQAMDVYNTIMNMTSQLFDCFESNGSSTLNISQRVLYIALLLLIASFFG